MREIKNVLLCGLGGVGCIYAKEILNNPDVNLKILVDSERYKKYSDNPRTINGKLYNFDYILPDENGFKADIVIIAAKSSGLNDIIIELKNFICENTIILSFVNGITSEKLIEKVYGKEKVLYSYIICHTIFRQGVDIRHDGITKVVFGSVEPHDKKIEIVKQFFDKTGLNYEIPDDILKSMWHKYTLNCCANQISALTGFTFKQLLFNPKCVEFMKNICEEVRLVAEAEGITDTKDFWDETLENLNKMLPEGKTSMLQDIEEGRMPEVDLFGKTVVELARIHNIPVFYNKIVSELIEFKAGR